MGSAGPSASRWAAMMARPRASLQASKTAMVIDPINRSGDCPRKTGQNQSSIPVYQ
jgi:hypothetical protein